MRSNPVEEASSPLKELLWVAHTMYDFLMYVSKMSPTIINTVMADTELVFMLAIHYKSIIQIGILIIASVTKVE